MASSSKRLKLDGSADPEGVDRHKIIVAIDYGTTYSGVSFVTTDKKSIDDINVVTNWPGESASNWKTPTRIAYQKENQSLLKNKWGFQVESRHTSYSWTKLLLDKPGTEQSSSVSSGNNSGSENLMQLPKFRDAPGVCEDFLREVYNFVSDELKRQMGAATFELTAMECWITLPAIWSDQAKDATLKAAKNAGFGNRTDDEIYTIAEPEAAAIATLAKYSENGAVNAVKRHEHVLVCDCGGGTVDITTYTILEVKPRLVFDELCVGVGAKCGSTSIDRNLHNLLSKRFGTTFDELPISLKGPGSLFMTCFEKIKRSFGVEDDQGVREIYPLRMKVKRSNFYDPSERCVRLSYEDMKEVFNPVVNEIIQLIEQQIEEANSKKDAKISRIILVGGFGESAYLNQELIKWFSTDKGIAIMRPVNPQSAVVRGAALRGLDCLAPRIKQARRSYGYEVGMIFREGVDDEKHSYIDPVDDEKSCEGRADWMIKKGEPIFKDNYRSVWYHTRHYPGKPLTITTKFISYPSADAPDRHDDEGVESVGCIISELPANFYYGKAMKSKYNSRLRKTIHYVDVEVQVVFGSKGDNLTFRTAVNGRVSGTSTIEFTSA